MKIKTAQTIFSIFFAFVVFTFLAGQNWHDVRLKVNLNTAAVSELTKLPWITEGMARAIVEFRQKQGNYNVVDELKLAFSRAGLKNVDLELLKKNLRLYCVSDDEWKRRVANNWHDLYPYQLQIHTFDTKGVLVLVLLPEGGNLLIGTGSVEDEKAVSEVKKILSQKSKIKKPIIDWLILPDFKSTSCGNLEKVLKEFRVKRVYTLDYGKIPATKAPMSLLRAVKILEDNKITPIVFDALAKIDFLQQKYNVVIDVLYPRSEVTAETSSMFILRFGEMSFMFTGDMGKSDLLVIFKAGMDSRIKRIYYPSYAYVGSSVVFDFFERLFFDCLLYMPRGRGVFCSDGVLCYIGDPQKSPPPKKSPYRFAGKK